MQTTIADIAALVGGVVVGDGSALIAGVNSLDDAGPGEIAFLDNPKYRPKLADTRAAAVLVVPEVTEAPAALIQVAAPRLAFAQVLAHFHAQKTMHPAGIHPMAAVAEDAVIEEGAAIDAFVRVESGARIGAGTVLYSGVYVGRGSSIGPGGVVYSGVQIREDVHIGARCIIHPGAVLGSDGFGFVPMDGRQMKIPQVGSVELGDDVEVGANTCIDRATFGKTIIGTGSKIDNLVQIGHNVRIGEHCVVSGLTGIAGTTTLGNRVTVGGYSGFAGHLTVGDDVVVAARSGVTKSIPAGRIVSDFPATDHQEARRIRASFRRLPQALRRLHELETRLQEIERRVHGKTADDRQ